MIQVLYTGASGLIGQQKNIDVIANNVANIQTDGFKKTRFDFQDCLYTRYLSPTDNSVEKNLQRGHGAIEYQTARIFLQGVLKQSDRALDVSLEGNGFFMVENPMPDENNEYDEIYYTRAGNFYISAEEEGNFLVDANGFYVLSDDRSRIQIPETSDLIIDTTGNIYYMDTLTGGRTDVAKLGMTDFVNRGGMDSMGNNHYRLSDNSGDELEPTATVKQGYIEGSNVDYAEESTRLIRAQRAYQLASRCISTADQMMQTVNNIRQ